MTILRIKLNYTMILCINGLYTREYHVKCLLIFESSLESDYYYKSGLKYTYSAVDKSTAIWYYQSSARSVSSECARARPFTLDLPVFALDMYAV